MKKIALLTVAACLQTGSAHATDLLGSLGWATGPVSGTCWLRPEGGFEVVDTQTQEITCRIICLCTVFGNMDTSAITTTYEEPAPGEPLGPNLEAACAAVTSDVENWEFTCSNFLPVPIDEEEENITMD